MTKATILVVSVLWCVTSCVLLRLPSSSFESQLEVSTEFSLTSEHNPKQVSHFPSEVNLNWHSPTHVNINDNILLLKA